MKTAKESKGVHRESEEVQTRFSGLADDLLLKVTGGAESCMEQIINELNSWLSCHPSATRVEIYSHLKDSIYCNGDELTPEELEYAQQLLAAFDC